jgi:formylglycine-generating enzyme required for sulfatase activity
VCGFDLEVGPIDKENPRNFLPGADIQNPVYCHVRTLMITEVLGGSVLDKQALEPFIGRKIEFGAKTTETTSDIAEPRAQEARGAEQRRQAGEALVAAGGVVVDLGGGVTMNMVAIKTGKFMMGSPDGQGANSERPVHPVEITEPFWLGQTEVTQAQWQAVMGNNPSDRKGSDRPVVKVSWNDATEFCKRLSEKTGMKFRLPTEAEWEYACRGGTTTAFHGFTGYLSGTNDYTLVGNIAWFLENRGAWGTPTYGTKAVGQKAANGFGLHDMSGNVWEFVNDWYSSSYYASSPSSNPTGPASGSSRVIRGGSWDSGALNVRSSARGYRTDPGIDVGFRVARTP